MIMIFWYFLGTVHCNLLRASGGFAPWITPGLRPGPTGGLPAP